MAHGRTLSTSRQPVNKKVPSVTTAAEGSRGEVEMADQIMDYLDFFYNAHNSSSRANGDGDSDGNGDGDGVGLLRGVGALWPPTVESPQRSAGFQTPPRGKRRSPRAKEGAGPITSPPPRRDVPPTGGHPESRGTSRSYTAGGHPESYRMLLPHHPPPQPSIPSKRTGAGYDALLGITHDRKTGMGQQTTGSRQHTAGMGQEGAPLALPRRENRTPMKRWRAEVKNVLEDSTVATRPRMPVKITTKSPDKGFETVGRDIRPTSTLGYGSGAFKEGLLLGPLEGWGRSIPPVVIP
jgi:hypothetical protein